MNKLLAKIRLQQIERAREDARCRVHTLPVSGQLAEADGLNDVECNPLRDAAGNIDGWCGTNTDIEDRKRGEQALLASGLSWRQIVDSIPGFVATMSATGEV